MSFADFEQSAHGAVRMDMMRWGYRLHAQLGADGLGALLRFLRSLLAKAAVFAALALWVVPGAGLDLDQAAVRGAVSVGLLMLAYTFWRGARTVSPEVHVDRVRKEVRVVERVGRTTHLKRVYRFADMGDMYIRAGALHLYRPDGRLLTRLALDPIG